MAGAIVILAVVAMLGVYLMYDPFDDLPSSERITVNLAGVFPAEGQEPLQGPRGIAFGRGRVYVVENGASKVSVFDRYGKRKGEITVEPAEGQARVVLTHVALTGDGRLAVVDAAGPRVLVFSVRDRGTAEPKLEIDCVGSDGVLVQPGPIAYADGVFYVTDSLSRSVAMYDEAGVYQDSLGGDLQPPLFYAGGIALLDGGIALSSNNDARVMVLGPDGQNVVRQMEGDYVFPSALTVVGDGGLAVADPMSGAVFVFDAIGRQTHVVSGASIPAATLAQPEGVAWDAKHARLYVADSGRDTVLVFNLRL